MNREFIVLPHENIKLMGVKKTFNNDDLGHDEILETQTLATLPSRQGCGGLMTSPESFRRTMDGDEEVIEYIYFVEDIGHGIGIGIDIDIKRDKFEINKAEFQRIEKMLNGLNRVSAQIINDITKRMGIYDIDEMKTGDIDLFMGMEVE